MQAPPGTGINKSKLALPETDAEGPPQQPACLVGNGKKGSLRKVFFCHSESLKSNSPESLEKVGLSFVFQSIGVLQHL